MYLTAQQIIDILKGLTPEQKNLPLCLEDPETGQVVLLSTSGRVVAYNPTEYTAVGGAERFFQAGHNYVAFVSE